MKEIEVVSWNRLAKIFAKFSSIENNHVYSIP